MNWHQLDSNKVLELTSSSTDGLSPSLVKEKQEKYGPNVLKEKKKKSAWMLFLSQFKDFMILVLAAAAIISGVAGDLTDMIIILVIILLNAIVGFIQEYRAENAMQALKQLATPSTTVIREGQTLSIPSSELVPGDMVLLEAGNLVPADLRLIETHSIRVEESSLTGESVPVDKTSNAIDKEDTSLGDRLNMAYKGTRIINGRGKGVVVATGMQTEIGRIAGMLQEKETLTPLQKRLADFGKKLSYIILGICILLFGIGLLRGEEPLNMLLVAISLAVAAIPEALPALITIALALGAKRLIKKNVLIRKLPAVETLGSVTFICSDKTGTLTRNKMTVTAVKPAKNIIDLFEDFSVLEVAMALNHDVKKDGDGKWMGDPTEIAMMDHLLKEKEETFLNELLSRYERVAEIPFDSGRKRMSTIHRYEDKYILIVKGATESLAPVLLKDQPVKEILKEAEELSAEGMRVLTYAYRIIDTIDEAPEPEETEKDLVYAGLIGMIDPPRGEAKEAIREARSAGIRPVMITGDHKETAAAIAGELGILEQGSIILTGAELGKLSPDELDSKVEMVRVYARVSPEQKLNIVKSLQRKKHFVAMTGDGVNDAPSLKSANIGIAMGITGTDVSKESAHMILLDDNFATIVKAVKEGRRIYDNIRKFVKYIMTCNSAEIWTIFMAPIIGLPIPLLPIHILWINLVTDGLPGLALSTEKADKDIMKRSPRRPDESLFSEGNGYHIIWVGMLMAAITLGTQAWAIQEGNMHWQTMVFTVLSLAQLGHVFAIRSDREFIFSKGLFSNLPLLGAISITFILQMAVIYLPVANGIFKTQPLSLKELLICMAVSAIIFHTVELEKWIKRKIR
ncbi:MAG TPA: cation-translocating P-type ATPase [Chitinophagaceae bacterium]|nr:cation-translocating P-type ATPase [Chitinophagaceae bacterium]